MNGESGLLNLLGIGAGIKPTKVPQRRNIPFSSSKRGRSFPTMVCPTCGGSGKVPDVKAMQGTIRRKF